LMEDEKVEGSEMDQKVVREGTCYWFRCEDLEDVLSRYEEVLTDKPGLTTVTEMTIDTGDYTPLCQHP